MRACRVHMVVEDGLEGRRRHTLRWPVAGSEMWLRAVRGRGRGVSGGGCWLVAVVSRILRPRRIRRGFLVVVVVGCHFCWGPHSGPKPKRTETAISRWAKRCLRIRESKIGKRVMCVSATSQWRKECRSVEGANGMRPGSRKAGKQRRRRKFENKRGLGQIRNQQSRAQVGVSGRGCRDPGPGRLEKSPWKSGRLRCTVCRTADRTGQPEAALGNLAQTGDLQKHDPYPPAPLQTQ